MATKIENHRWPNNWGRSGASRNVSKRVDHPWPCKHFLNTEGLNLLAIVSFFSLPWENSVCYSCVWDRIPFCKFLYSELGIMLQLPGRPWFPVSGSSPKMKELEYRNIYRYMYWETFRKNVSKLRSWQYNPFFCEYF